METADTDQKTDQSTDQKTDQKIDQKTDQKIDQKTRFEWTSTPERERKKRLEISIVTFREQYRFHSTEDQNIGELRKQLSEYITAPMESIVLKLGDRLLDDSELIFTLFEHLDLKERNVSMEILGPPADLDFEEVAPSDTLRLRPGLSLDIICPNDECNTRQYYSMKFGQFDVAEMRTYGFQCMRCRYYCTQGKVVKACFTNCKIVIKGIKKDATLEQTAIIPENVIRMYSSIVHPNWSCWNVLVSPIMY